MTAKYLDIWMYKRMRDRDNVNIMLTDREQIPCRMKGKKSRGDECITIAAHCEGQIPYEYKGWYLDRILRIC